MSEHVQNPHPYRRLPQQPNLEQLRKQAKELLEHYRAGEPAAVAEVHQFELRPDASAFALNDAQRVLARAYGYRSWSMLKAFVEGVNVQALTEAVKAGDMSRVRSMLNTRPDLVGRDLSESNEHRALHFAVLRQDAVMVRLLMEAGADARQGIYPHRDATSAFAIASDRQYHEIVAVIEAEERLRREELSCPNATVSPVQDQINAAISEGDAELAIRLLTEDGSLIQACDRHGATPLHLAAREGNQELAAWLLDRRAKVNKRDVHDRTALDLAALAADPRNDGAQLFPPIARLLLQHGAQLTIAPAVALGNAARVCELLAADPSLLRNVGRNGGLLSVAVNHGRIEMVRLLLDLGADVDERIVLKQLEEPVPSWGFPLYYAAMANHFEITELLLDRGADPNSNVYASGWPLSNAWNHPDGLVKKLLLARGAKPQPYMVAEAHDVAEARRLLEADTSKDLAGELAWAAADHGCPAIVELALARLPWRPDDPRWHWILIQPIRGATENHLSREGHFACLAVLLRHGIDPNVSRYGQTPLHFAAGYRGNVSDDDRARFVSMLVDYGADLGLRDDLLKSTPLGWACRWGRKKMVEVLLARGALLAEAGAEEWATPTAWAQKMGRKDVIAMLSEG